MNELILYTSSLTDTRVLERALKNAGRPYRVERMGMGDAAMRARFEELCDQAGVRRLPLIQDGSRWLGELEVLEELAQPGTSAVAPLARWLGYAGVLPFVAGPFLLAMGLAADWWLSYAMLILAFMAGSQWGAALAWRDAPWSFWLCSVAAPLIAWPLLAVEPLLQAWALALLFGALLALDRRLQSAGCYPRGYFTLRLILTSIVMASLAAGALVMAV